MGKRKQNTTKRLGFKIDKLTSSIENKLTGETFETEITRIGKSDKKLLESADWQFDWIAEEAEPGHEVYKLVTREKPDVIHGLISLEDRHDHIYLHLLENVYYNIGRDKTYVGVAANLVAFACKMSFEKGYGGGVVFTPKTKLFGHYEESLGAKRFTSNRMLIDTQAASRLVHLYFKDFDNG